MMATEFGAVSGGGDGLNPAFFPRRVGDVFFNRADGDGAVARLFEHAIAFAQAVPAGQMRPQISGKVLVAWLIS